MNDIKDLEGLLYLSCDELVNKKNSSCARARRIKKLTIIMRDGGVVYCDSYVLCSKSGGPVFTAG